MPNLCPQWTRRSKTRPMKFTVKKVFAFLSWVKLILIVHSRAAEKRKQQNKRPYVCSKVIRIWWLRTIRMAMIMHCQMWDDDTTVRCYSLARDGQLLCNSTTNTGGWQWYSSFTMISQMAYISRNIGKMNKQHKHSKKMVFAPANTGRMKL